MSLPLIALAAAAFGIGTSEFVIMGLLPNVAADLGVSIGIAGLLITAYALGVVVGAPIVAVATSKWPRKATLIGLASTFVLGNLCCALSPSYNWLMTARVLTAFCHGAFFGIGAVVAADLVPRAQRSRAIALMFTGLTLANVLGVPLGTWLGQLAGWRSAFWAVCGIGLCAVLALWRWLPGRLPMQQTNIMSEFRVLKNLKVLWPLLASVLASAALFCVFTYIAPLLQEVSGISEHGVTGVLLLYGVALTVGSTIGGRLGGRHLEAGLRWVFASLALIFILLTLVLPYWIPALPVLFVWGVLGFSLVPMLQTLVVDQAAEAPNLASTLNQGAFNLGNAAGAWLGSLAIRHHVAIGHLPLLSALISASALVLVIWGTARHGRLPTPLAAGA